MAEFASKGVAGAGLGLGIAGTALSLLGGGLGNLLGGGRNGGSGGGGGAGGGASGGGASGGSGCGTDPGMVALVAGLLGSATADRGGWCVPHCNETIGATRYDLGVMERLAAKDAEIAKLSLSQEVDGKILALYQFVDAQNKATGQEIAKLAAGQAVVNQQVNDNMAFIQSDLNSKIALEAERRCCGDNSIVTYLNSNFQPKAVAGFTPSADAPIIAETFNPLSGCGCGCGR